MCQQHTLKSLSALVNNPFAFGLSRFLCLWKCSVSAAYTKATAVSALVNNPFSLFSDLELMLLCCCYRCFSYDSHYYY